MKSKFRKSLLYLIGGILAFGNGLYWFFTDDFQTASNWRILFSFLPALLGFIGVFIGIKRILQFRNI